MPAEETELGEQAPSASRRRIPRAVWLIVALNILLMVGYTVLVPAYRGPDEAQHVDLVLALRNSYRYPQLGQRHLSPPVVRSMSLVHYDDRSVPHLPASEAVARGARPSFNELGPDTPTRFQNQ